MKIARVMLRVTDLEQAVEFWSETVGFDVVFSGGAFAFLDGGGVQLALNEVDRVDPGSLTELVIEVDDFESEFTAAVERGVPFEVEPRTVTSEGGRDLVAAHFRDPDGNLASLTGWVSG